MSSNLFASQRSTLRTACNTALGGSLWEVLAEQAKDCLHGGLFISPFSIALAMLLTANGTKAATQQEILQCLRIPLLATVNAEAELMLRDCSSLLIANSIWLSPRLQVRPEYKAAMEQHFQATVETLNSIDQVNQWCSSKTNGLIPNILTDMPPDTAAVLINALYFKGSWRYPFPKHQTKIDFFWTLHRGKVNCRMMHLEAQNDSKLQYTEQNTFQAVKLPYQRNNSLDQALEAVVILPKHGLGEKLDFDVVVQQIARANKMKGTLEMPKFKIESSLNLQKPLQRLGVQRLFKATYDMDPLIANMPVEGIRVTKVIHKTVVEVDEEGTVAAAATAVCMAFGSAAPLPPETTFHMRCDRPFYFLMCDSKTKTIVFLGLVNQPATVVEGSHSSSSADPAFQPYATASIFESSSAPPGASLFGHTPHTTKEAFASLTTIPLPKHAQDSVSMATEMDRALLTRICNEDGVTSLNEASNAIASFIPGTSDVKAIFGDLHAAYCTFSFVLSQWHFRFAEAFPYAYYNLACVQSLLMELLLLDYKTTDPWAATLSLSETASKAWKTCLPMTSALETTHSDQPPIPPCLPATAELGEILQARYRVAKQNLQMAELAGYTDDHQRIGQDRDLLACRELQDMIQ